MTPHLQDSYLKVTTTNINAFGTLEVGYRRVKNNIDRIKSVEPVERIDTIVDVKDSMALTAARLQEKYPPI